jgi:hypothetical protein
MPFALLVLGVCVAAGIGLAGYWLLNTEPAKIRKVLKWMLIIGACTGVIALISRGNPSYLWSAGLFLVPLILRWRRISRYFKNAAKTAAGPSPGQSSTVRTGFLEMNLDHDTGAMFGTVLAGQHAGRTLDEMSLEDLLDLLSESQSDPQSVQLLESFIDRAHGDEWRFSGNSGRQQSQGLGAGGGAMSRAQALEILGVGEAATEKDIRDAHRRLMLANHPDRGGSTFLAAQINQAKEVLLGA